MKSSNSSRNFAAEQVWILISIPVFILFSSLLHAANDIPEVATQLGHRDQINTLKFSTNGEFLATGAGVKDRTVKIWDVKTCRELLTLSGMDFPRDLLFHPNGYTLLTASETIDEWDIKHGKWIRHLSGHDGDVNAIVFSPDYKLLASGGRTRAYSKKEDNTVKIWDWPSGKLVHTFPGHDSEVVSLAFSVDGSRLVSASHDGDIKLWDLKSRRQILALKSKTRLLEVSFMKEKELLLVIGYGQVIEIWNTSNAKLIKTYKVDGDYKGYMGTAGTGTFSYQHDIAATTKAYDSSIFIRNVYNGNITGKLVTTDKYGVSSLAFSPNGRFLSQGAYNGTVRVWDVKSQKSLCSMQRQLTYVNSIVLSQDGKFLFSGGDNPLMWDLEAGLPNRTFHGHEDIITDISISSDENYLAASSRNSTIKVWNINNGKEIKSLQRLTSLATSTIAFKPQSDILAAAYEDGAISVWDTKNGKQLWTQEKAHIGAVNTVAFSNDGDIVASAGGGASIIYVSNDRGSLLYAGIEYINRMFSSFSRFFFPVASAQSNTLKPWDPDTYYLNIWDSMSGRLLGSFIKHTAPIDAVRFSQSGYKLASGSRDGTVRLWDFKNALIDRNFDSVNVKTILQAAQNTVKNVNAVAFDNKTRLLAAAYSDRVKLYNLEQNRELGSFTGHDSWITDVLFSPESHIVLTSSDDGTIRVWRTSDRKQLATIAALEKNDEWVVFTSDGFFDGSRQAWGLMPFQFLSDPLKLYEPEQFFNQFYQPGLLADIMREGKSMREILRAWGDPRASLDISQYRHSRLPEVRISNKTMGRIAQRTITVSITARDSGSGLRDIRLFRNNTLVHFEHGTLKPEPGAHTYRLEVPVKLVAGNNHFTAYVFNKDNLKSKDAHFEVHGDASLKRKGTAYVLSIGINQYSQRRYNLNYAVADATATQQQLGASLDSISNYARVVSIALLDNDATRQNILTALAGFTGHAMPLTRNAPTSLNKIREAQPEDVLIVYFAGHGQAEGDRYYLLPHDLQPLSDRDLEKAFEKVDAGNIMLVIDACQSGKALDAEEKRRGPMNSRGLAQLAYEKGMYILAAAQSDEAAKEFTRLGHGLLTYTLLEEGLKQRQADAQPRDNQITAREWLDYAVQRVPQLTTEAIEEFRSAQGRGIDLEEQTVTTQAPRAYYRRETTRNQWIVSKQ